MSDFTEVSLHTAEPFEKGRTGVLSNEATYKGYARARCETSLLWEQDGSSVRNKVTLYFGECTQLQTQEVSHFAIHRGGKALIWEQMSFPLQIYSQVTPAFGAGSLQVIDSLGHQAQSLLMGPLDWMPKDDRPAAAVATGHHCRRCNDFNEYAAANRPDGSYLCFGCRS